MSSPDESPDNKKNPLGPTGVRLAGNIQSLRKERGLSYKELSARLADLGRDVPTLGLSRIEQEKRRVDADDLVALALALEVTPNRLLLTGTADSDQRIGLTANHDATEGWAWTWASGEMLPLVPWPPDMAEPISGDVDAHKRRVRFAKENNPRRDDVLSAEELIRHMAPLRQAAQAVHEAARQTGLPTRTVLRMAGMMPADEGADDGR